MTNLLFSKDPINGAELDIPYSAPIAAMSQNIKNILDLSQIDICSFSDFIKIRDIVAEIWSMRSYNFLFRGHADYTYKLLPTIARYKKYNLHKERTVIDKVIEYGNNSGWNKYMLSHFNEDLFYMGICRHLGLHCRLLDWTSSLETALQFACENNSIDGAIWIMAVKSNDSDDYEQSSPFNISDNLIHIFKEGYYIPDGAALASLPLGNLLRMKLHGSFSAVSESNLKIPLDDLIKRNKQDNIEFVKIRVTSNAKADILKCFNLKFKGIEMSKKCKEEQTQMKLFNKIYYK